MKTEKIKHYRHYHVRMLLLSLAIAFLLFFMASTVITAVAYIIFG